MAIQTKRCATCGEEKPLWMFKAGSGLKGKRDDCRHCVIDKGQFHVRLTSTHDMTLAGKIALFTMQKGQCAICAKTMPILDLQIDHDHISGRVRGLLCKFCNVGLGFFKDNVKSLKRASRYLNRPSTEVAGS